VEVVAKLVLLHPLSPVFQAGHAVITAIREARDPGA
jgi:hypothetical protein